MELVDVSNVSPALFATGAILILMIGAFFSLGVLRLFQLKKKQGITYLALFVLSIVALVWIMERWFVE